jgi:adenosylhomocysteine nucleosidase
MYCRYLKQTGTDGFEISGMIRYLTIFATAVILLTTDVSAQKIKYAVVISANAEWKTIRRLYPSENYKNSPWGEYFYKKIATRKGSRNVLFFHEGWGKVAAAGGTQYVIDKFDPEILINLGTCGGFEGKAEILDIILAERTVIYDIKEAMGDSKEAIADYTTEIDLSWLGKSEFPVKVKKSVLVSADRDLVPSEIPELNREYTAFAGDWESGAIAYVCKRNNKKILILRGITDLVNTSSGEAYNNLSLFGFRTDMVMSKLIDQLPLWIDFIEPGNN